MDHIHQTRINHTIERAFERYNLWFIDEDILLFEQLIINKHPLIIKLYRKYVLRYKGSWIPFGFDSARAHITTCLPKLSVYEYTSLKQHKKRLIKKYSNHPNHPYWEHLNKSGIIDHQQRKAI